MQLDHTTRRAALTGAYYQWAPLADESTIEAYVLRYTTHGRPADPVSPAAMPPTTRASVHESIVRPTPGSSNYEIETVLQRGHIGDSTRTDLQHRASLLHAEIGYQFDTHWAPNVVLQYDRASGDPDPKDGVNERFDTLFGDRSFEFGPTGLYGAATRSNLDSPGVSLTFRPQPRSALDGCIPPFPTRRSPRCLGGIRLPRREWRGGPLDRQSLRGRRLMGHGSAQSHHGGLRPRAAHGRAFARETAGSAFQGNPYYSYFGVTTTF